MKLAACIISAIRSLDSLVNFALIKGVYFKIIIIIILIIVVLFNPRAILFQDGAYYLTYQHLQIPHQLKKSKQVLS